MDYTLDADGEYTYTSQICAVPGHEYQFKFRVGEGDHWVLDENSPVGKYPSCISTAWSGTRSGLIHTTEADSIGNKNNLLSLPLKGAPKATRSVPGKVLNELGIVDMDSRSSTPMGQVAGTAAQVADTAQGLDHVGEKTSSKTCWVVIDALQDDSNSSGTDEAEYSWKEQDTVGTPLFSHESFGACDFADDDLDHGGLGLIATLSKSKSASTDCAIEDVDVNDPTIEKFPEDRGSVIDTLRKIQSSLTEDQVPVENAPPSPRNMGWRASIELADDGHASPGSLSPASPTASRVRDNRLSHSSFGKNKSAVSLSSIAEEPKPTTDGSTASQKNLKKPRGPVFEGPETSPSDEDDGVNLGGKKVIHRGERSGDPFLPDHEGEQPTDHKNRQNEPRPENFWRSWLRFSRFPGLKRRQSDTLSVPKMDTGQPADNV